MVIDTESVKTLYSSAELRLAHFFNSGKEALDDFRTLISVDSNNKIVVSCRRSSFVFLGKVLLWGCVALLGFRFLVKLGLGFRRRFSGGFSGEKVTMRRDRSLGGKEVVVSVGSDRNNERIEKKDNDYNPVSVDTATVREMKGYGAKSRGVRRVEKLPKWWPLTVPPPALPMEIEEAQRMANKLVGEIMEKRIGGRDITEEDIVHLRRICRTSGARVQIETANVRDSFYRASVGFILKLCSRADSQFTSVEIDGEDVRQFISGFANNIGLENIRAARIVSAAVAARTRSYFLQAWAFEMQGQHAEALSELSKICLLHQIFPPEESSPEMEMVARGLERHLKLEQREQIMNMLQGICHKENSRSLSEALGLVKTVPTDSL